MRSSSVFAPVDKRAGGESALVRSTTLDCKGEGVIFRRMRVSDYPSVRKLMPSVSRCFLVFDEEQVAEILSLPTFFAWCCFRKQKTVADREKTREETGGGKEGGQEDEARQAEGDLLGYCEMILQPHWGRKPDGRLERVVVSEHFRGRGLATQMCREVIQVMKESGIVGRIDLTVEKPDARHVYEDKLGFKEVDTKVLRLEVSFP